MAAIFTSLPTEAIRSLRLRRSPPFFLFKRSVAASAILLSNSNALDLHNENHRQAIDLSNNAFAAPVLQESSSCADGQARLQLTLNTDAHSVNDNSWRISHMGSVIESGSVVSDDAVLGTSVCVDINEEHECWDFELHDEFGDGLTAPHSESGRYARLIFFHSNLVCCYLITQWNSNRRHARQLHHPS